MAQTRGTMAGQAVPSIAAVSLPAAAAATTAAMVSFMLPQLAMLACCPRALCNGRPPSHIQVLAVSTVAGFDDSIARTSRVTLLRLVAGARQLPRPLQLQVLRALR